MYALKPHVSQSAEEQRHSDIVITAVQPPRHRNIWSDVQRSVRPSGEEAKAVAGGSLRWDTKRLDIAISSDLWLVESTGCVVYIYEL